MKRFLIAILGTAVMFATVANAATLTATTDKAIYNLGELVTITLTGTTTPYDGSSLPDATTSIDVRIAGAGYSAVSAETGAGGTCVIATGCIVGAGWVVGGTQGSTVGGNFIAFSQIGGLVAGPLTNNMTPGVPFSTGNSTLTAVFTTIAAGSGYVDVNLASIGVGFFGVAGPTLLAGYQVVPEPTTAALMGLGLLGLALSGRRR